MIRTHLHISHLPYQPCFLRVSSIRMVEGGKLLRVAGWPASTHQANDQPRHAEGGTL